jgi:hypothetical protein
MIMSKYTTSIIHATKLYIKVCAQQTYILIICLSRLTMPVHAENPHLRIASNLGICHIHKLPLIPIFCPMLVIINYIYIYVMVGLI